MLLVWVSLAWVRRRIRLWQELDCARAARPAAPRRPGQVGYRPARRPGPVAAQRPGVAPAPGAADRDDLPGPNDKLEPGPDDWPTDPGGAPDALRDEP